MVKVATAVGSGSVVGWAAAGWAAATAEATAEEDSGAGWEATEAEREAGSAEREAGSVASALRPAEAAGETAVGD